MSSTYKSIRVLKNKYSDTFDGCYDCIYCDDTDEICMLRRCVHAFYTLKDCYIPKKKLKIYEGVDECTMKY